MPARSPDLSALVHRTTTPAFAIDAHGWVMAANRPASEVLGLRAEPRAGRPCWEVIAPLRADGSEYCTESCGLLTAAIEGCPGVLEWSWWRRPDGSVLPISATVVGVAEGPGAEGPADGPAVMVFVSALDAADAPGRAEKRPRGAGGPLTARELEVLGLIASGYSNREVAERLMLSPHTVRTHVQHILGKLAVHSKLAAVAAARQHGLLASTVEPQGY